MKYYVILAIALLALSACSNQKSGTQQEALEQEESDQQIVISRDQYHDQLYGFWLGQCIANWTGLITEMDKVGNIGEYQTGAFYTRADWGKPDQPSIWGGDAPSNLSATGVPVTIDFVFKGDGEMWGADDDTDIEYMYQHLLLTNQTSKLTPEQIRAGWLKHIKTEEENYLWVSNQRTLDLMVDGVLPPETSDPAQNEHFDMIDAQLTTEIFGLFAPTRPDVALEIAHLPIRTTARQEAAEISEFYVVMHSLASKADSTASINQQLRKLANQARSILPDSSYTAHMYDYVKEKYESDISWEQARDSIYYRYQVDQHDGYDITSRNITCNGCFAAGINFAASLVSLFYGEGDITETIKIGTLAGWDSDNPTATWGGLIGFMIGKGGVEKAFERKFSNQFNIHRTRQNFPNDGVDTFENMASDGIAIIDRVVKEEMGGTVDLAQNVWIIPAEEFDLGLVKDME